MKNKVAIFINPSNSYLFDKVKETYTNWGFSFSNMNKIEEWYTDAPFQSSLFEEKFVLLDITSEVNFKKFKSIFDKDKKNAYFKSNWYGSGVIIIANNNQGNWLTKIADFSNGYIERPIKIEDIKKELIKEFKLSSDNAQIVIDTIGEDYSVYSIVKNTLSNLSSSDLKSLSQEELLRCLPSKKGSVPPWNLISAILNKDIEKASSEYERVKINTHPLVLTALIKNKLSNCYKYLSLKEAGYKENDMLDLLNTKSTYAFIDFRNLKVSSKIVSACLKVLLVYEDKSKGGLNYDRRIADSLFLEMVTKIIINLKENKEISTS